MTEPAVLAHAYGIPEALTVVVPMVVLAAIVIAGKRRKDDAEPDVTGAQPEDDVST